MPEDLITDLSKLAGLFVISRSSVFVYKGKAAEPADVSRELGFCICLKAGSVKRAAGSGLGLTRLVQPQITARGPCVMIQNSRTFLNSQMRSPTKVCPPWK